MEISNLSLFLHEWLGLMIDAALIVGVFCLWLTWYRNGKRQQKMEQLLIGTAQQLEEASMHLSQATDAIEQLQKQQLQATHQAETKKPRQAQVMLQHEEGITQHEQLQAMLASAPASDQHAGLPPQNSTQATMILRMQREGESEGSIADRLDIPLAQVKLMLKLHASRAM